jgi:predicted transcriptional regulator
MPTPRIWARLYPVDHRGDTSIERDPSPEVGTGAQAGYTRGMKTAISIPDEVFQAAERLAAALRQSRSQLYSRAVREYVARHSEDSVTAALDAVCAVEFDSGLDFVRAASTRTLDHNEW